MNLRELLSHLVSIHSSYPGEEKIGRFVEKILKEMDFEVNLQKVGDKRFNILAEKGKGPALLIFGHLDTVEEKNGWKTNPYSLTQKEDKLYGLGAWDMKGGITAVLSAIKNFSPKKYKLKLAFVVDEEYVSIGMHSLIKSGWLRDVFGAVSVEPGLTHGVRGIAMGRIGRPVYSIKVITEGGHTYMVKDRPNAIEEAANILRIIKRVKSVNNEHLGDSLLFPRFIQSDKTNSMVIPSNAYIEIEGQIVPPQTSKSVLAQLKKEFLIAKKKGLIRADVGINLVLRKTPFCEPFIIRSDNSFVKRVSQVLKNVIKEKPVPYYRRSVGDENRIAVLGIPVVTIGPSGGNAHDANEWVSEKSLFQLEKFLSVLILSKFN